MSSIKINHEELEYFEKGSGEPLIFVHGSVSDYRTFQNQLDTFSRYFRTIIYSRRYHWPNRKIPGGADYSMPQHVDDLQALIRALCDEPAHIVGHSYGAFLCLLLALREPGMIKSLILGEPPVITLFVSSDPGPLEIAGLLFTRPRTAMAILKFVIMGIVPAEKALKRGDIDDTIKHFGKATLGKEAFEQLDEARRQQVHDNFIKAEFVGSGFASLDQQAVKSLQIPVMLIESQKSPAVFHRCLDGLQELLPECDRIVVPSTSHIMHEDNPEYYNNAILSFLKKNRMKD